MGAPQQALVAISGAASSAGALDSFTANLWACYGITRQRSSLFYSGSAIRVRKSTGGDTTTEQDIGFTGSALDTTSLATFAGSETVVVTKLYDQSGNGRDASTATTSRQPRIVNAGVYDGYIRFDASDDELLTTATSGTGAVLSVSTKDTLRGNTPTQVVYACGPGGVGHTLAQVYIPNATNALQVYIANSSGTASDRSTAVLYPQGVAVRGFIHQLGAATAALSNRYYLNGTDAGGSAGGTPTGSFTAETWRLGSGGGANYAGIDLYSFAIWEADQNANMAAIATAMA